MLGKKLINAGPVSSGANTFASENFNTVLYTGNGSAQRIGGYINRGAVFNGSTSYITIPNIDIFTNTEQVSFSISCWFRTSDTGNGVIATDYPGANYSFYLSIESGILKSGSYYVNTPQSASGTTTVNDGNWHHVVIINNASDNTQKVYLDGNSTPEISASLTNGAKSTSTLVIGYFSGLSNYYFNGVIDQFRIFNKVLSTTEITTLYGETFASTTISTTDIFDDNSGVALYQLDGNANDTGGVSGRLAGTESAIFSNSNSNFNLGTATVINNNFGISFWVKVNKINSGSYANYIFAFMYGQNFQARVSSSGELRIDFGSYSADCSFGTSHTFTEGVWYHIAITGTYTSNPGTVTVYVNGSSVGSGSNIGGHNTTMNLGNRIGSYHNATTPLDGQIEEFRIYKSTSLSASDITALYSGTPPTTGLTNYFKFNGNDRNYASDRQLTPTNVIYNYSGTASNVTYQEATKFSPDLVWIKQRNDSEAHFLQDSVRGSTKTLYSSGAFVEFTEAQGVTSFNSNGFTLGNYGGMNGSSDTYVAWCFNAGGGSSASNTDGDITSTVKANTAAGFSIVSYSGNNASSATIGHGLNSAPEIIFTKARNFAAGWPTMVKTASASLYGLRLNSSSANDAGNGSVFYNNTAPTASVYTVGGSDEINDGYNYISYCFHSVNGYQKIGTYTGNGSTNGTIVETGFEPAFLMIKKTDGTGSWYMYDNKRTTSNPRNIILQANDPAADGGTSYSHLDFLSNGFQLKTTNAEFNGNNGNYIYLAIAADPDQTDPTVENSFDVVTYAGNGTTQDIETDFKPDFVWIKARDNGSNNHLLTDSIRGVGVTSSVLSSNLTGVTNFNFGHISSFNSNGFTVAAGSSSANYVNSSSANYVAWCWKAGDHDENLPQINTEGTIDSIVSVNDAAGFSIVKYKGTGSNATVGHGLSAAPELIFVKTLSSVDNWMVLSTAVGATKKAALNATNAFDTDSAPWNDTAPTSTVFSVGTKDATNKSGDEYIAYCWYSVTGHSKIGSYTGTGATGNAQTLGFRPRFIMIKSNSNAEPWFLLDSQRDPSNPVNNRLMADSSAAEDGGGVHTVDFTNTGFTANGTVGNGTNGYGVSYIYMAFK